MQIEKITTSMLQVNTYFLIKDQKCLMVDPSGDDDKLINFLNKRHLELEGIVLTHGHFDHFISCNNLNIKYNVPLYVYKKEIELLYDGSKNASLFFLRGRQITLDPSVKVIPVNEETHQIGSFDVKIFHVPGHSPGSICLYFKDEQLLISGDTLFKRSIGRGDLYQGNEKQLITNIKAKLMKLPDDTKVYPGHGDETTIGQEKKENHYLGR
jgi:hydroxyacylglutathione hydrolase